MPGLLSDSRSAHKTRLQGEPNYDRKCRWLQMEENLSQPHQTRLIHPSTIVVSFISPLSFGREFPSSNGRKVFLGDGGSSSSIMYGTLFNFHCRNWMGNDWIIVRYFHTKAQRKRNQRILFRLNSIREDYFRSEFALLSTFFFPSFRSSSTLDC